MKYAAICDDSREWLERAATILEYYIQEHVMDMQLFCYNDTEKCIEELPSDAGVLFMDIEWEEEKPSDAENMLPDNRKVKTLPRGIEAAGRINSKNPDCRVVYLTNHLGYALDVYQTDHAWYVLKEQFEERLPEVFEKLEALEEERQRSMVVRSLTGKTVRIICSEICYIERVGRKTVIVTENDEIEVRSKVTDLESLLPTAGFARCHNSIIVNLAKVKEIHQNQLVMEDGQTLLISRGYSRSFRKKYMNWAKDRVL